MDKAFLSGLNEYICFCGSVNGVVKCKTFFYIGLVIILVFPIWEMSQLLMKYLLREDLNHQGFVF